MFEVQALRGDGWHLISTPQTRLDAVGDAAAEHERSHDAVRIMTEENGIRVQLRSWGNATPAAFLAGPTPTLR